MPPSPDKAQSDQQSTSEQHSGAWLWHGIVVVGNVRVDGDCSVTSRWSVKGAIGCARPEFEEIDHQREIPDSKVIGNVSADEKAKLMGPSRGEKENG
jgi:hypothetical protein